MKVTLAFSMLLSAVCVVLTACQSTQSLLAPPPNTALPQGQALNPPRQMPDFTLTNQDGKPTKLSDLRGKVVMIFFGYTYCPDICPTSMANFRQVKRELGDRAEQVYFVMISVDGTRDTPTVLKRYVQAFDPEFIGLTGDEATVRVIGVEYGVHFERQTPPGTQASYLVAHTTYSYLLDGNGLWRMVYAYRVPAENIVADIKYVLSETKQ